MADGAQWKPYTEPVSATITRTLGIALVVGFLVARFRLGMNHYLLAVLIVLWFSVGGHFVEIFFLNWMRERIPSARTAQLSVRLVVWFVGGALLALGMAWTASVGGMPLRGATRWLAFGGAGFILAELIAHGALQLRGRPSFYNGLA